MSADVFGVLVFLMALVGLVLALLRRASRDGVMLLIWAGLVVATLDNVIRVPSNLRMLQAVASFCLVVAAVVWDLYRRRARAGPTA
jgi:cbb3-type cytochrome oxidase subunit 3